MKFQLFISLLAAIPMLHSCQKEAVLGEQPAIESIESAARSRPFEGFYITRAEFLQGPSVQRITGNGQATHLGESMFVANATVDFSTLPPFAIAGTAVFTAANGDQFFTQFRGTSTPTGPGTSTGIINHTIIGGTGRFDDATGNIVGTAYVVVGNPTNTVSYTGMIDY